MASPVDSLLDVVRALAGAKFDDAGVGQAARAKWILLDDGLDLLTILANRQDDAAFARDLSARDEKMAGGVVLPQEGHMSLHVGVYLGEIDFVCEFDDEHVTELASKRHRRKG